MSPEYKRSAFNQVFSSHKTIISLTWLNALKDRTVNTLLLKHTIYRQAEPILKHCFNASTLMFLTLY